MPYYPTRKLTILAMDPSVRDGSKVLRTQIEIPNEALDAGPQRVSGSHHRLRLNNGRAVSRGEESMPG